MINYLRGKVLEIRGDHLVLDVSGVGYKVENHAPFRLGLEGQEVALHIYTHVKETELRLFGFSSYLELTLFEHLLDVSGVGPKSAMAVISNYSARQILHAIKTADASGIRVKGVGAKTLAKIVIELKGKTEDVERMLIQHERQVAVGKATETNAIDTAPSSKVELSGTYDSDLASALANLGYKPHDFSPILPKVDLDKPFAEQIKQALQLLRGLL